MTKFVLGLMSGTSADGLTVCAICPSPFKIIRFKNYPYSVRFQQKLLNAFSFTAPQLSQLNYEIGSYYAETVLRFLKEFHIPVNKIASIGMHGQTIYHGPHDKIPNTLQLGEPSFLAAALHCPVVSDFRAMDIVLGGEGAPLMPFFDQYIWGKGTPKIVLNIGGIANLSLVGENTSPLGFDCGPGNTLIDLACQQHFHRPFDKGGTLAARGTADMARVNRLLKQSFFTCKPPKSLDKNFFGKAYLQRYFPIQDPYCLLATLTYFTAACVARAIRDFIPLSCQQELIVCGGGSYNATLLRFLQTSCPQLTLTTSATYGIDPQAKEAAAFALFAYLNLKRKTNHSARCTGAMKNTILGKVTL